MKCHPRVCTALVAEYKSEKAASSGGLELVWVLFKFHLSCPYGQGASHKAVLASDTTSRLRHDAVIKLSVGKGRVDV